MHTPQHERPARRRRQKGATRVFVASTALLAGSALAVALLRPSPIDPAVVEPEPEVPREGPLAPNDRLRSIERLPLGKARGPEDIAIDSAGRVYTGVEDGRILRLTPLADGSVRPETLASCGGRPLGLRFASDGTLITAVAGRGLIAVDPSGEVRELTSHAGGVPIRVANHLAISRDGTIYFTDSSARHDLEHYRLDLLEGRPSGRLLAHEPAIGETRVLASGLSFPNGIALAGDEQALFVAETGRSRVLRYPLAGGRAGRPVPVLEGLPGYPDNLARDERGRLWVALFTVRNRLLDRLHPHPWLKGRVAALPGFLQPDAARFGLVVSFDETGRILESLQDPGGRWIPNITSAVPYRDSVYLGTLETDWLGRLDLAAEPARGPSGGGPR